MRFKFPKHGKRKYRSIKFGDFAGKHYLITMQNNTLKFIYVRAHAELVEL